MAVRQHYSYFAPTARMLVIMLLTALLSGTALYFALLSFVTARLYHSYLHANVYDQLLLREPTIPADPVYLSSAENAGEQLDARLIHLALIRLGLLGEDDKGFGPTTKKADEKPKEFAYPSLFDPFKLGKFRPEDLPALVKGETGHDGADAPSTLNLLAFWMLNAKEGHDPQPSGLDKTESQKLIARRLAAYLADAGSMRQFYKNRIERAKYDEAETVPDPAPTPSTLVGQYWQHAFMWPGHSFFPDPQPRGEEVTRQVIEDQKLFRIPNSQDSKKHEEKKGQSSLFRSAAEPQGLDLHLDGLAMAVGRFSDQLNADEQVKKYLWWMNVIRGPEQLIIMTLFVASMEILLYRTYRVRKHRRINGAVIRALDDPNTSARATLVEGESEALVDRRREIGRAMERLFFGEGRVSAAEELQVTSGRRPDDSDDAIHRPGEVRVTWKTPQISEKYLPDYWRVIRISDRKVVTERLLPVVKGLNLLIDSERAPGVGFEYQVIGVKRDGNLDYVLRESRMVSVSCVTHASMRRVKATIGKPAPILNVENKETRLSSNGNLIGGQADSCGFFYQQRVLRFDVTTIIKTPPANTPSTVRAGLMVRQSLDLDSPMIFLGIWEDPESILLMVRDSAAGLPTLFYEPMPASNTSEQQVRIRRINGEREDAVFRCEIWKNGQWVRVRDITWSAAGEQLLVGQAVAGGRADFTLYGNAYDDGTHADTPTELKVASGQNRGFVQLTWTPPLASEATYEVYRSLGNAPSIRIGEVPSGCGCFIDEGPPSAHLYYELRSMHSNAAGPVPNLPGEYFRGGYVSARLEALAIEIDGIPAAPACPVVRPIGDEVSIFYSHVPPGLDLLIERSADGSSEINEAALASPLRVDSGLQPDTLYIYRLRQRRRATKTLGEFGPPTYYWTEPAPTDAKKRAERLRQKTETRKEQLRDESFAYRLIRVAAEILNQASLVTTLSSERLDRERDAIHRDERRSRWLVKWMAYAMPAVDFIGTVRGISQGLGGADGIVRETTSVGQAAAITDVTSMLGLAFATTVAALSLLLFVNFLDYLLAATEAAEIDRVHDRLLPRLER